MRIRSKVRVKREGTCVDVGDPSESKTHIFLLQTREREERREKREKRDMNAGVVVASGSGASSLSCGKRVRRSLVVRTSASRNTRATTIEKSGGGKKRTKVLLIRKPKTQCVSELTWTWNWTWNWTFSV